MPHTEPTGEPSRRPAGHQLQPHNRASSQVLLGSVGYLLPVLKGSPFEHSRAVMARWPCLPLLAANGAGACIAAGWVFGAVAITATWIVDFGVRVLAVVWARPSAEKLGTGAG